MQNIVLVGVGGTGISSLAYLLHDLGYSNIVGIDKNSSEITEKLQNYGVKVIIGHGKYTVHPHDFVIYSDATCQSQEVKQARSYIGSNHKRIFPPLSYFQFLGEVSKYFTTISVAGTHGKSTTTALMGTLLSQHHQYFGLAFCGALVSGWNQKNYLMNPQYKNDIKNIFDHIISPKGPSIDHIFKKYLCVVEADEYNHHLLFLDTDRAIITNIELDHTDVYENFEAYVSVFQKFVRRVRHETFVLSQNFGDIKNILRYTNTIKEAKLLRFSFRTILGGHNHNNASLVLALGKKLCRDIPMHALKDSLEQFSGLRRRGELLGHNMYGVPIISDYGHHPTELASTLNALYERYPNEHITCVFQAHQARRVLEFWDDFVNVLQRFDTTLVYSIYTARENFDDIKLSFKKKDFLQEMNDFVELGIYFAKASGGAYMKNFEEVQKILTSTNKGIIVVFSAGDLDRMIRRLMNNS